MMTFLAEIQSEAVNSSIPVADLLRKCKILAARLNNQELAEWAENELEGYESVDDLPNYRVIRVNSYGNFSGPFGSGAQNMLIPPATIPEEYREIITTAYLQEPIGSLEGTLKASDGSNLRSTWPPDLIVHVGDNILERMVLLNAWRQIPLGSAIGIIDTVRSRVLSFALAIEAELGEEQAGQADLKSIPDDVVTQVFHTHIHGNVTNLAQASSGVSQVSVASIEEGNLKSLKEFLRSNRIDEEDLKALEKAIKEDKSKPSEKRFGRRVSDWVGKMVSKAAGGTWDIATSVAAKILSEAIEKFYGLS